MTPPATDPPFVPIRAFVRRMRWIMLAVILADIVVTFLGQPASYWTDPTTVHEGNKLFHPIMARGFGVILAVDLVYLAGTFLLVTWLPWRLGVILLFGMLLGHYFGASTWLVFRFGLGLQAAVAYAIVISACIALVAMKPEKD